MNPELQQVLRSTMNKAALTCLRSCSHSQAEIDRVAHIKDDELLYVVAGMGGDCKIIVRDVGYTHFNFREILLDSKLTKTAHLKWFSKALHGASKAVGDGAFLTARHLAEELDIRAWLAAHRGSGVCSWSHCRGLVTLN